MPGCSLHGFEERHVVNYCLNKALSQVETGHRMVAFEIVDVLWGSDELTTTHLPADVIGSRDGFCPGIGCEERQTLSQTALCLDLHRVIVGISDGFVGPDHALIGLIRTAG